MNVLMLSWEYPPNLIGGLGAHVAQLAPVLAAKGVRLRVLTPAIRGGKSREGDAALTAYRVPPGEPSGDFLRDALEANERLYEQARQVLSEEDGDWLVHAHDWLVGPCAERLKHEFGLPLLATIHATEHGRNHGIHNEIQRRIHEYEYQLSYEAQAIIACSKFMAAQIRDVFDCPPDKITVIPNGVVLPEPDVFDRQAFRRRYALDHERLALFVGRLVAEKGIDVVLRAVPRTLEILPDVKFVIVGSGPALPFAREQAAAQDWGGRVIFTGFASDQDRNRLYRVADVALFPSLYEPFGIVALEAMSFRTPVVVAESGGLAEVVERNETGVFVQPGSEDSLAWGIVHVLRQPKLSHSRVEAAYARVVADFNWDVIADRTIDVYRRLLLA